jgi:hypothetical protein
MAQAPAKVFTWRVSQIPIGTTKEQLRSYFVSGDQDRIDVDSLCPDVDADDGLVATIRFHPHAEHPHDEPKPDRRAPELDVKKDFKGFTPLYCPPVGTPTTVESVPRLQKPVYLH